MKSTKVSDLYIQALTHRSWSVENGGKDYEILEFIGDSVLQLCITELLVRRFPTSSEGELSILRHKLVNNERLAVVARELNLGQIIRLGHGESLSGGRDKTKILANVFEALIGAVYQDRGLDAAREIVNQQFQDRLADVAKEASHKKTLHEWVTKKYRSTPVYEERSRKGPEHDLVFTIEVFINGVSTAVGHGPNKREASHKAAENAIAILGIE